MDPETAAVIADINYKNSVKGSTHFPGSVAWLEKAIQSPNQYVKLFKPAFLRLLARYNDYGRIFKLDTPQKRSQAKSFITQTEFMPMLMLIVSQTSANPDLINNPVFAHHQAVYFELMNNLFSDTQGISNLP